MTSRPAPDNERTRDLGLDDVLPGEPTERPGPVLLLGPVLRHSDTTRAVVWVETSRAAEVEVCARRTRTFEVQGHHYGYLVVDGLAPGTDIPYDVRLDGDVVWPPPDDPRPAPRLRTSAPSGPVDLVFGSCRVDRPHERPWDLEPGEHPDGVGVDALQALSLACQRGSRPLPDLLLMLGDQVYADEGLSPKVRAKQRQRRAESSEPRGEVADFEEYTWLYLDSWSNPDVRWLLSTVPSAMVFDDHDVRDDWNTSREWRHCVRRLPWWRERIRGAYMSYWLYQHLGNVSPDEVEAQGLLARVREGGVESLREFAEHADDEVGGRKLSQWSYRLDLRGTRLVVVDTRSGRVLEDDRRSMLSEPEWEQVEQWLRGGCDHLVVATSVPVFLERSLHDLEQWNEAVAAGAWGSRAARAGERLRQALDLEHWAAFGASFDRMVTRLLEVARGDRGPAPRSVVVLSGDVHHSYVAPVRTAQGWPPVPVVQAVSSPMRNAFPRRLQRGFRFAATPVARAIGRLLRLSVRLPPPTVAWTAQQGPMFGNVLGTLRLDGDRAEIVLSRATARDGEPVLEQVQQSVISR
ncbi:MAG TPA: alkaline phosphatase D family protein [Mycobacteriales bacterium]|nr:alkaline phosphatase D family protein [Mycobacteriales bacterium]